MKDFCKIEKHSSGSRYYLNNNDQFHRLYGPSIQYPSGSENYHINSCLYMYYDVAYNELCFCQDLIILLPKYEIYIKQNINNLIKIYNPKTKLSSLFPINNINLIPNFIKNLIIL